MWYIDELPFGLGGGSVFQSFFTWYNFVFLKACNTWIVWFSIPNPKHVFVLENSLPGATDHWGFEWNVFYLDHWFLAQM